MIRLLPAIFLLRTLAGGATAFDLPRSSPIAQPAPVALTFAALTAPPLPVNRTVRTRSALRTDSAVPIQAFRLPGCAFFIGLRRAAVTFALTTASVAGGILGERTANGQQGGDRHDCKDVQLHNCILS
jgi:hypothetical protein